MHIYEQMNDVLDIMWGNLMEADKYIKEAHDLKDTNRFYADWCKEMGMKHIEFNTNGKTVFDRMRDMLLNSQEHVDNSRAMVMIFDRQMAKLNRHCAEIKALMEMYK